MKLSNTYYTSRSAIETYQTCQRKRYLEYFHLGTGVRQARASIPLTTGTCVHTGVGVILNALKFKEKITEGLVDIAVEAATKEYEELVKEGFRGNGVEGEWRQDFVFNEQLALTEALVRLWAMREAEYIEGDFEVVETEQEDEFRLYKDDSNEIILETRADALLKSKKTKNSYMVYSLKTAKMWNERNMKSYRRDLQGITEQIGIEGRWERQRKLKNEIKEALIEITGLNDKHRDAINLLMKDEEKWVQGVRFCILVKGDRRETSEGSGTWVTYNPFIRGYKKVNPDGVEWAHSYYFENKENKSGRGALGKGWESFNVWEREGGVKKWMEECFKGVVQPNAKGELEKFCISPPEVFRNRKDIEETLMELQSQEIEVMSKIELVNRFDKGVDNKVKDLFRRNRKNCYWPSDCEYIAVCHEGVEADPETSEAWEKRVPHHVRERDSFNGD